MALSTAAVARTASSADLPMTVHQPDLFGLTSLDDRQPQPALAGFTSATEFISSCEEAQLVARIDAVRLEPFKFQQWEGKRLTASFGWDYDFTFDRVGVAPPFPDWLLPIRDRAAAFARLRAIDLAQALLIRYDRGAGIGWHKDRPVFEHVIGISLGHPATMRFRRRKPGGFDRASAELAPRSIYHLAGEVRHGWEHSIGPMDVPRWSITFRSLA